MNANYILHNIIHYSLRFLVGYPKVNISLALVLVYRRLVLPSNSLQGHPASWHIIHNTSIRLKDKELRDAAMHAECTYQNLLMRFVKSKWQIQPKFFYPFV